MIRFPIRTAEEIVKFVVNSSIFKTSWRAREEGWILLCVAVAALLNTVGCSGFSAAGTPVAKAPKINHVVIIFQENRTPDNLFQDPVLIMRGADIASSGQNSKGQTIPLHEIDLGSVGSKPSNYDLSHAHSAFLAMYDHGKMGAADLVPVLCNPGVSGCPPANAAFAYVNPTDVQPYFQLAEKYTFADRMFQTNQGPSFPAHQFIIAGTSAPSPGSDLFVAENPYGAVANPEADTGCTANPLELVGVIDPLGAETSIYPCFDHPTLTDLLNNANISWLYYAPSAGSIWTAPNAIQHMCGPNAEPPNATTCTGKDWMNNVVLATPQNPAPVLTSIAEGRLPSVSWVIPSGQASDHPVANNGSGPSWVASIVNAIGNSPYWSDTVIFITWDDWGGWYDHVAPPIVNAYEYGFRVPMIVVSPYAKAAYISHQTHDFGSILKYIEENFGLPSLGYADADADNLADCFDFTQTPIPFETVTAPLKAEYFLNNREVQTDPDDD